MGAQLSTRCVSSLLPFLAVKTEALPLLDDAAVAATDGSTHSSGTQPTAPSAVSARADELRVFSANVWCHYFSALAWMLTGCRRLVGTMSPLPFRPRLDVAAEHAAQHGADVVVLQELFVLRLGPLVLAGAWEHMAQRMARLGLVHASDPRASLPRFFGQNSGLAIFSRHPLHPEPGATSLFRSSRERFNRKGVECARVAWSPGASLMLCATHFDAHSPRTQEAQLGELNAAVSRCASAVTGAADAAAEDGAASAQPPPPVAIVVCGDFNISPPTAEPESAAHAGEDALWPQLIAALAPSPRQDLRPATPDGKGPAAAAAIVPTPGPWLVENAWGPLEGAQQSFPRTREGRTPDHVWLARPRSPAAHGRARRVATTVGLARTAEPLALSDGLGGPVASDHAAVLATLRLGPEATAAQPAAGASALKAVV